MVIRLIILVSCIVFSLGHMAFAASGYVYKVKDGDSLLVKTSSGEKIELRLYGIDSPEWDQDGSRLSYKYLQNNILKRRILFKIYNYDRYGRAISLVKCNGVFINKKLVEKGYSWVYPQYCKKKYCEKLKIYQLKAKKKRIGIWAAAKPIPPWKWRRKK